MIIIPVDCNDPRRLETASASIIAIAEYLPELVDELEQIQKSRPTPRSACLLLVMRNSLENMLLQLHGMNPDLIGFSRGEVSM